MFAEIAFALALQAMPQAEFLAEGEQVGRLAGRSGACQSAGYEINDERGLAVAKDFSERAKAAGWNDDLIASAISSGSRLEEIELSPFTDVPEGMSDAELRRFATEFFATLKTRCASLAANYPGVIVDVEQGHRNADAKLAIMLRPLDL